MNQATRKALTNRKFNPPMDLQKVEKILNKMDRMLDKMGPADPDPDTDSMFEKIIMALGDLDKRISELEKKCK